MAPGFRLNERAGGRRCIASYRAGGEFVLRLVVPHLRLSEQPPALVRVKHRALAAQGFHCAVANEICHIAPPTPCPELFKTVFKTVSLRFWEDFSWSVPEPKFHGIATLRAPFVTSVDGTSASRDAALGILVMEFVLMIGHDDARTRTRRGGMN